MKKYRHLLGVFRVGERQKAAELAWQQFRELVKSGELSKGKEMAFVEIRVFLVDGVKEEKTT